MEHEANVTQRSKCFDNLLHLRGEYDFCTGRRICSFKHWGFCASGHAFDRPGLLYGLQCLIYIFYLAKYKSG